MRLHLDGRIDNRGELLATAPPDEREAATDQRLLLARYRRLGEAFLDAVRGPFAVIVVDPAAGRALAGRDGMGNRLLSYVLRDDLFAATAARGRADTVDLLSVPGVSAALDPARLAEYFAFDEVHGNGSFFCDVRIAAPGELLIVERETVRRRQLWRPRLDLRLPVARWEDAVEELFDRLRTSVARAVGGSRRVAVWLSGGLDSTPIAALASRLLPATDGRPAVDGVCWQVADPAADDRPYVEAFAAASGVPIAWVDCEDGLPFAELARWPVHPASPEQTAYRWFHERSYARARALGAERVLTGFSGDQLWLDARRWFWTLLLGGGAGRAIDRLRRVAARDGWPRTLRSEVVGALLPKARRLRRSLPRYLRPEVRQRLAARRPWPPDLARARRPRQAERVLALLDAHGEHLEAWYAARHGLELATPLRDGDLVQFLLAVPDHLLRQGDETRPLLRAAIRGLVPEEVRQRRGKASFRDVFIRGFAGDRLAWAKPLLGAPDALWRDHVEAAAVDRWLAGDLRDDEDYLGFSQCLFAELWRRVRGGDELAAVARLR